MHTMGMGYMASEDAIFKRKFRWAFEIFDENNYPVSSPIYHKNGHFCKTCSRPKMNFSALEIRHIIETVYIPARAKWDPISITLFDMNKDSYMYQWMKTMYDPTEGQSFPVSENSGSFGYPKKEGHLYLYDGHGDVMESWIIHGCWPENIDWGNLDYSSNEICEISFTLRYDRAEMRTLTT